MPSIGSWNERVFKTHLGIFLTGCTFSTCSVFPFLNLGLVSVLVNLKNNKNKPHRTYFKQTPLR